jgi:hypothetical protein
MHFNMSRNNRVSITQQLIVLHDHLKLTMGTDPGTIREQSSKLLLMVIAVMTVLMVMVLAL